MTVTVTVDETNTAPLPLVVVHWNATEWCRATVADVLASEGLVVSVRVVDNGGGPLALGPDVIVLRAERNLGYAGGANLALRAWLGEDTSQFCVVASHDVHLHPAALLELVRAATRHPQYGILGPEFSGSGHGGRARGYSPPGIRSRDWVSGSCLLLRRKCLLDIGLFDESFGSYVEDTDLCYRAREAGWRVGSVASARAGTQGSRLGRAERVRLSQANHIYFLAKHRRWAAAGRIVGRQLMWSARHRMLGAAIREPSRRELHRDLAQVRIEALRLGVSKWRAGPSGDRL